MDCPARLRQAREMMIDPTSRSNGLSSQGLSSQGLAPAMARQPRDAAKPTPKALPAVSGGVTSEVRGIARDMAANPPVDSSKVAALRSAIASGAYHVDAGRLADAMIGSVSSATPG